MIVQKEKYKNNSRTRRRHYNHGLDPAIRAIRSRLRNTDIGNTAGIPTITISDIALSFF
jgi:hypothetical protein